MPKSRNWCFTYFPQNEGDSDYENDRETHLNQMDMYWSNYIVKAFNCAVGQIEKCPDTGRLHFQGYGECHAVSFNTIRNKLHRCHVEPRKGSRLDAIAYCIKDDTRDTGSMGPLWHPNRESFGDLAGNQGSRTDLKFFIDEMSENGIDAAMEECPETFVRYYKGFERLNSRRQYLLAQRDCPRDVHVLWGDPGTGKSRQVCPILHDYKDVYRLPLGSSEWWDNYNGQSVVLLDDFFGQIPFNRLLAITDRHPVQLPTKGGFTSGAYVQFYITSNVNWEDWFTVLWNRWPLLKAAFKRRIKTVTHYWINDNGEKQTTVYTAGTGCYLDQ